MAKLTVGQAVAVRNVIRYLESLTAAEPSDVFTAEAAADALASLAGDALARMMAGPGQNTARDAIAAVEQLRRLTTGGVEQWAVIHGNGLDVRVSSRSQALQLAEVARGQGDPDAYAAQRMQVPWRRALIDEAREALAADAPAFDSTLGQPTNTASTPKAPAAADDPDVDPLPSRYSSTIRGGHRREAYVPAAASELEATGG